MTSASESQRGVPRCPDLLHVDRDDFRTDLLKKSVELHVSSFTIPGEKHEGRLDDARGRDLPGRRRIERGDEQWG